MVQRNMKIALTNYQNQIRSQAIWLMRRQNLVWRILFSWLIGIFLLASDEVGSLDTRFTLRGQHSIPEQVVVITLHPDDLVSDFEFRDNTWASIKELSEVTDSFYWDPDLWVKFLTKVLKHNPQKIGVLLQFGEVLGPLNLPTKQMNILRDPKIVWSTASLLGPGKSLLSNGLGDNLASQELLRDDDGVIRRFPIQQSSVRNMIFSVSNYSEYDLQPGSFINYTTKPEKFVSYSFSDIMNDQVSAEQLKNKIILISSTTNSQTQYLTPFGASDRARIFAQMVSNIMNKQLIYRTPLWSGVIYFLFLVLASLFVLRQYPTRVAMVVLIFLSIMALVMSAFVFDNFSILIPGASALGQIAVTWMIFIGAQANRNEQKAWRLQQEQKYLQEVEQLKSNFVSLFSHDLKTPIAKIQSIVDRLLLQSKDSELLKELTSLRSYSEELNRYIQSILKISRIESRDFKIQKEATDINELIEEVVHFLAPLAEEKQIELTFESTPLFAMEIDPSLIREVILNLAENAIKYSLSGGQVKITTEETDDGIWVLVSDNGIGIEQDELLSVWQKFVRGKDQDLKTKGTGLGLYLVKYFVELHNGKISLTSQKNQGTTVKFFLPF